MDEKPKRMDPNPMWYVPIQPFVDELTVRFQEATQAKTHIVNLSYSHPRGFFPACILHRQPIRDIVKEASAKGWVFDRSVGPVVPAPNHYFTPKGYEGIDLSTCDIEPYVVEISLRYDEANIEAARQAHKTGKKALPIVDLTTHHKRGGIPPTITNRIEQRKNPKWREEMGDQAQKLYGEANKAEAHAKTMRERADGISTKPGGGDPTNLLRAAAEADEKAKAFREQARFIKRELGEAA